MKICYKDAGWTGFSHLRGYPFGACVGWRFSFPAAPVREGRMDEGFQFKVNTLIVELLRSGCRLNEIVRILVEAQNSGIDPLLMLAAYRSERDERVISEAS